MKPSSLIFFICFVFMQTLIAGAHPKSFRDHMSKYDVVNDKARLEIMEMDKEELDVFREYLTTCSAGKNFSANSTPYYQCLKEEMNFISQFTNPNRTLAEVIAWLSEDREKAVKGDEMLKTGVHQVEGLLQIWVRDRYQQLRKAN